MYPNLPSGSNILGVYPGSKWGSPDDEVIILAAHWDTMQNTDGYNDNGSGVAAILTISQILAGKIKPQLRVAILQLDRTTRP